VYFSGGTHRRWSRRPHQPAGLLQELGAVDAVRSHELDGRHDRLDVFDHHRWVVVDDAAVVDEVGTAVLILFASARLSCQPSARPR